MKITDDTWQCSCHDIAQKRTLLQLAADCGVKVAPACWGHDTDRDLFLNNFGGTTGIGSLPGRIKPQTRATILVYGAGFERMCLEHADHNRQPTPELV